MKLLPLFIAFMIAFPAVGLNWNAKIQNFSQNFSIKNLNTMPIKWISGGYNYSIPHIKSYTGVGLVNGKREIVFVNYSSHKIVYKEFKKIRGTENSIDLLIITPSSFYRVFEKLAKHKEEHGIKTKVVTLDEIYKGKGRDNAEKIKYFIKDEVEKDGVKYVLLAGSVYKLPIRYVVYHFQRGFKCVEFSLPTDLYYADLYRYQNGSVVFSSWDTNNNGIYGEVFYGCHGTNDTIDLYPDVYVGRLACNNIMQAKTVVNKIIRYEDSHAKQQQWFKRLLLVGGDTFPGWGVWEGEFMNNYVANIMQGFQPIKMWASDGTISPLNVEKNLEIGGGFLYYSGHGFPYGWATHKPDDKNWTGLYITPYVAGLFNDYRLPIIFFDACLTAKLDFNSTDLRDDGVPIPINATFPCFAWYFVAHKGGGAIATIGATRVAFTGVDENGPYAGSSFLAYQFFKSYMNGNYILGKAFATAQENYVSHLWDRWTLEEFTLLGDPSLHIGGYD